ncbi:MAG: HD domain-containing phosphohydrolase [Acidimicrobiales bacterium]
MTLLDPGVVIDPFFGAIVSSCNDAIIAMSTDGHVLFWNQAAERLYGYEASEIVGRDIWVIVPPEIHDDLSQVLSRVARGEAIRDISTQRVAKRGTTIQVSITLAPIVDADGLVLGISSIAHDMTALLEGDALRTTSERKTKETLAILKTVGDSSPVGLGFVDRSFRIVHMNDALASINGSPAVDQIGNTVADVVPEIWPQVESLYRRVLDEGQAIANVEVTGPVASDSEPHSWLMNYYPVRVADEVIGVGIVAVDITDHMSVLSVRDSWAHRAVGALAAASDARDPYTGGHQRRVAELATAIARKLGIDDEEVTGIRLAASIHDIGKMSIPIEILSKPGKLSPPEMEIVKSHSRAGAALVADVDFPWPVSTMILQHHERLDGSGYPDGIRGDEIIIGARIIAVADVLEAMSSHRPYRASRGMRAAVDEIDDGKGRLYDAAVVEAGHALFAAGQIWLGTDALVVERSSTLQAVSRPRYM